MQCYTVPVDGLPPDTYLIRQTAGEAKNPNTTSRLWKSLQTAPASCWPNRH